MEKNRAPFVEAIEDEAFEQLQEIRSYRRREAVDADAPKRAKLAMGIIGSYVRLRATIANEKSNELIERRLALEEPMVPQKRIG